MKIRFKRKRGVKVYLPHAILASHPIIKCKYLYIIFIKIVDEDISSSKFIKYSSRVAIALIVIGLIISVFIKALDSLHNYIDIGGVLTMLFFYTLGRANLPKESIAELEAKKERYTYAYREYERYDDASLEEKNELVKRCNDLIFKTE